LQFRIKGYKSLEEVKLVAKLQFGWLIEILPSSLGKGLKRNEPFD